jgi:mitochondrial fission protein ELM1
MESQCLGLSEALGIRPNIKRIALKTPWRQLSPYLRLGLAHAFTGDPHPLQLPWPDLLIATGRQSVPASLYVRTQSRLAGTPTRTVQIQNPIIAPTHFDLVVAPLHDKLNGPNVISTLGALHRVTPKRLADDAAALRARVAHLPLPYIGVLIGGANGSYRLGTSEIRAMAQSLSALAARMGASLIITPSRRTGENNVAILRDALGETPAFLWDGQSENPYYGILGMADFLIVTADSVNMISEACASGRPVYIYDLPGGSEKTAYFHRKLTARGLARIYNGSLHAYPTHPFDEMAQVVEAIERLS